MTACPRCGRPAVRGVLCEQCAAALPTVAGLLPQHVSSRRAGERGGGAWLIDGFGVPHALTPAKTVVGRRADADLAIHNTSVSRDHAELRRAPEGWQLRDLGSRNGTFVDEARVNGRVTVANLASVRFGGVAFLLVESAADLRPASASSIETSHTGIAGVQYHLGGDDVELCLIGGGADGAGGALLHRARGAATWAELDLPPLEHQLLQILCEHAAGDRSPSASRGAVPTKALIKKLAFQSRYANEENVRQVVKRVRTSLAEIGAEPLLGTVPGRGYFVRWTVSVLSRG